MMKKVILSLTLVCLLAITATAAEGVTRLFILSGQSNMGGLKPDTEFTPHVKKAFPDDNILVAYSAWGGQPIRMWLKDWKFPEGKEIKDEKKPGWMYDRLLQEILRTTKSQPKPVSVVFCWMQGERDAKTDLGEVYEKSLKELIAKLRKDVKAPKMGFVIGRLSDHKPTLGQDWDLVRKIHVKVAEDDPLGEWIDTDDLNGNDDNLHLTREGYGKMGERFAEKAVALSKKVEK